MRKLAKKIKRKTKIKMKNNKQYKFLKGTSL